MVFGHNTTNKANNTQKTNKNVSYKAKPKPKAPGKTKPKAPAKPKPKPSTKAKPKPKLKPEALHPAILSLKNKAVLAKKKQ